MLCLENSYAKECTAKVIAVNGKFVELDTNLFYPQGGGQPADQGTLSVSSSQFRVVGVKKQDGKILHELDREPKPETQDSKLETGDLVHCALDWEYRYKLMRMHTTAHLLCAILHTDYGALVSGGQLGTDVSRLDFTLESGDASKAFEEAARKANEYVAQNRAVKWYTLAREEALKIPGVVKLATALPPTLSHLRIVEIEGVDIQADGGTHVKNLSEIGSVQFVRMESKGAKNKRMYFSVA